MGDELVEEKILMQPIEYDGLFGFVKQCNYATLLTYQLPNKADSLVDDLQGLMEILVSYFNNEDDRWRVKKESNVEVHGAQKEETGEKYITLGKDRILYDVAKVFAIVKLNSFFVIPGPRSLSEGHFNPSEVLQISNLIAVKPLVMMLANEVVDEEKDVWKLTASFKGI